MPLRTTADVPKVDKSSPVGVTCGTPAGESNSVRSLGNGPRIEPATAQASNAESASRNCPLAHLFRAYLKRKQDEYRLLLPWRTMGPRKRIPAPRKNVFRLSKGNGTKGNAMPRSHALNRSVRGRTGLRNRNRSGIGPYSRKSKRKDAETYDRPILDHPNHPFRYGYSCCTVKSDAR
jgi:hypothetical protein